MTEQEIRRIVADELRRPSRRDSSLELEVLTAEDAAAFLGVDRNTVYDYANRGQIPHRRLGRRLLFSRSALIVWLDSCKSASNRRG